MNQDHICSFLQCQYCKDPIPQILYPETHQVPIYEELVITLSKQLFNLFVPILWDNRLFYQRHIQAHTHTQSIKKVSLDIYALNTELCTATISENSNLFLGTFTVNIFMQFPKYFIKNSFAIICTCLSDLWAFFFLSFSIMDGLKETDCYSLL